MKEREGAQHLYHGEPWPGVFRGGKVSFDEGEPHVELGGGRLKETWKFSLPGRPPLILFKIGLDLTAQFCIGRPPSKSIDCNLVMNAIT